ncbi:5-formyltetrahydrofolate cyclo-ligase [Psychrobacter pygoscelis]|uniref:5-formyltetrahydrofolate cyclo-ligase n=1 Tax=Psychrobacter pygoscelis TaxID=2488563 RepID=UPI00103958B0|nr:5-formyltetrahydrofolate cyclo-ligase [Psychrobacter pygoscelis]
MSNIQANLSQTDALASHSANQHQSKAIANPPRRHFTRQRRKLTAQQRNLAASLASRHLYKLISRLPHQAKVGIYYDDFGELPTQPILNWCNRLGYFCYLPVVGSFGHEDKRLRFAKVNAHNLNLVPTAPHSLGMQQTYQRKLVWAHELDVLFCPLVAADLQGNRMGMGGGYYDTTLAKSNQLGLKKPLKIGWCYDFQVTQQLKRQPWDVPLDGLMTPSKLRWF